MNLGCAYASTLNGFRGLSGMEDQMGFGALDTVVGGADTQTIVGYDDLGEPIYASQYAGSGATLYYPSGAQDTVYQPPSANVAQSSAGLNTIIGSLVSAFSHASAAPASGAVAAPGAVSSSSKMILIGVAALAAFAFLK